MRYVQLLLCALVVSVFFLFLQGRSAYAAFHCMRIHAVMAGFNGDNDIQYVELRMSLGFQTLVGGHQIKFYDASDTLKATFTFPTSVSNGSTGDSILVGTQEFNDNTTGGNADFTFSMMNTVADHVDADPLHPLLGLNSVYEPDGRVTFAEGPTTCLFGGPSIVDSVAYGNFTGTVDYGSSPAPALPSPSDNRVLRLNNLNLEASNNSTEYPAPLPKVSSSTFTVAPASLTTDLTTPRNNARTVLQLGLPTPTPTPTATSTPTETSTPTVTPTPTPTPPPVGGIAELPNVAGTPLETGGSSGPSVGLLAGISAAITSGALALSGAAWYARRRWLR